MTLSKWRIAVGLASSLTVATALAPSSARTQPAWPDCSSNYPGDIPPQVTTPNLAGDVKELCYHGFAVTFSGKAPGPLSSSHFLTRQRMAAAEQMDSGTGSQTGTTVYAEMRLPQGQRAQLSAFAQSGYTAQQLSSTANMPDIDSRADSRTVANTVPVTAALSQGPWTAVQRSVRNLMAQIDVSTSRREQSTAWELRRLKPATLRCRAGSSKPSIAPNKVGPAPISATTMLIRPAGS